MGEYTQTYTSQPHFLLTHHLHCVFLTITHFPCGVNIALHSTSVLSFIFLRDKKKSSAGGQNRGNKKDASSQLIGILFLFILLCCDGGTGAYKDKLMSVHSV
jgi:hypothetical protein